MSEPLTALNALIERLSLSGQPLHELSKSTVWLKLDIDGNIKGLWCVDAPLNEDLMEDLEKSGNVFRLFDFDGLQDLEKASSRKKPTYALKPEFSHFSIGAFARGFYTDLPVVWIRVLSAGKNEYLGLVTRTALLPNMDFANPILILFADRGGKIRGFNRNFYDLFSDRLKHPADLIGQSLRDYLSPTPAAIQEQYFKKLGKGGAWEEAARMKAPSLEFLRPEIPSHFIPDNGILTWENPTGRLDFTFLHPPLDLHACDYRFTVTWSPLGPGSPLLVLGADKKARYDPDYNGYLAGETPDRSGLILKRRGFTVDWTREKCGAGKTEYGLLKTDRGLVFETGAQARIKFFDPHFLTNPVSYFSIGLRPGGKIALHGAVLEKRKSAPSPPFGGQMEMVVKFNVSPPRFFSLIPFYNFSLNSFADYFPDVMGYALSDVTSLQEKVTLYRQQYESEKRKGRKLKTLLDGYAQPQELFVGESPVIRKIKDKASIIAGTQAPVLIEGPTGTGKEVLAHYIHEMSPRKNGPFIKVDCSTLPAELIESELFGHEKGSFTGAVDRKIGRFEQAHGGTLFLDEISNLNRTIQAKLLNVLQDMAITRVGGSQVIQLDVRLLTASNVPLEELIRMGAFREDLFYRLNTVTLRLPPLKERTEDIPALCGHFLQVFNANRPKPIQGLTAAAYRKLLSHPWPGNVRELKNTLHRAVMFCEKDLIGEELIALGEGAAPEKIGNGPSRKSYHLKGMGRKEWIALAARARGVISDMMKELGVSRPACYNNLAKYGIDINKFRPKSR